jgi:aryl-alcohol dehydrogenase-like predicted oxidoreductase
MHSLNDLVVSGQVLYLGISDTPAWVVSKANQYARDHGLRQFVVYQGGWNAAMRDFERDIIPMCKDEGMGLAPYGVLGQGQFQTEAAFAEREKNNEGRKFYAKVGPTREVSRVLEKIANAKGGKGVTDIALAYVMHKAPYVFPIVGARKLEHIQGSLAALSISLTEGEIREIEDSYHFDHGFPHTFLSGTLFNDEAKPKQAEGPQDVFLLKPLGEFDWVEQPKPIKPSAQ